MDVSRVIMGVAAINNILSKFFKINFKLTFFHPIRRNDI